MKLNRHMTVKFVPKLMVVFVSLSSLLFVDSIAIADTDDEKAMRADEITTIFRAARAVISQNQAHVNDPDVGDKGLSGEIVIEQAKANYVKAKGKPFVLADPASLNGQAQRALLDSISSVMDEAAALINEKGKGFKGFLPAVFAKSVADQFTSRMNGAMTIKLTAPKAYVRNRKNRPDTWEASVIEERFKLADYEKGRPFWEAANFKGQMVFRYMIPEYYGESCLGCHGEPKGDRDITGGLKEGGVLGELGGAISLTIAAQ